VGNDNARINAEFLAIATSLCVEATFWRFLGRPDKTARLVQQACDLMVTRDLASGLLSAHEDCQ
jgi:hypothetical protein